MSDDKPKRDDGSSSIPPELKPFVGQQEWPEAERRDEAEVDAAFGPVEAMVAEWQREADKRDAARGIGNVSAYAAGVVIREAEKPATKAAEPKVALAIVDVPRKLPSGNPNLPTEEISTRAFSRARSDDDEVTQKRAEPTPARATAPAAAPERPERTVGGNTEKMPVIAVPPGAQSPWTKAAESDAPPSEALPSALRPRDADAHEDDAPGSVTPARRPAEGRARWRGFLLAGVALLALGVGVRAMTRATTDGSATRSDASGGAAAPPIVPSARAVEPKATSEVAPPVAPSAPSTSASARAAASAQVPVPSATAHPLAPQPRATSTAVDDPYDAAPPPRPPAPQPAAPLPQPTSQPAAPVPPPTVTPAPAPTQKPPTPSTTSATPLAGPPVY